MTLSEARRRLVVDALGMTVSATAFGIVYGVAARQVGYSAVDALAMSVLVLAGAAQFAAVGLVAGGVPWPAIVVLTAFLNARHLLYSAAIAPWVAASSRAHRAAMAHVLTDETFALALAHFRRLSRPDRPGYWLASAFVCVPWIAATLLGFFGGSVIPDPRALGLDIVFPAAMAGLAVALVTARADVAAAGAGVVAGIASGLAFGPTVGVVVGGLLGPLAGMAASGRGAAPTAESAGAESPPTAGADDAPSRAGHDPLIGARP